MYSFFIALIEQISTNIVKKIKKSENVFGIKKLLLLRLNRHLCLQKVN